MTVNTLCVFGTRPEAIKMAPLIKELEAQHTICNKICVTEQHQQMLESVLNLFEIKPDFNLRVMTANQDLSSLTSKILLGLAEVFKQYKPDFVLVHGDTTTTLAASLSAYYHRIPVVHIEAGLRTGDMTSPWPEEANRKLAGALAVVHFAPTPCSRDNLLREGVAPESIYVTGNTVIDALNGMVNKIEQDLVLSHKLSSEFSFLSPERRFILVTGHRRENFGEGFERICQALAETAVLFPHIDIVYPVHLNPHVQQPVKSLLGHIPNIHLIEPVDYLPFVYLMKSAYIILTDSGGIQEEAPSLGKPVLVMRDITERPEAVASGTVKLVGTDIEKIVGNITLLVTNNELYQQMSCAQNPYGDGKASERIAEVIVQLASRNSAVVLSNPFVYPVEKNTSCYRKENIPC
jgi:UDP-N-acetylglucosamine 2-epimerase (non-hydrolysing)